MSRSSHDRAFSLLNTARTNPEFGRRLVQELSPGVRDAFVSELAKPESKPVSAARPGIAKCSASPYQAELGLAAQLRLVARQASRVR